MCPPVFRIKAIFLMGRMPTHESDQRWRSGSTLSRSKRNLLRTTRERHFVAYLAKRFADTRAEETLKKYMDQFLEAASLPEQLRLLGRIRRLFAVVYASAAQAIDYGVLPWGKKATLKAILACMKDAMDQLTANFSDSSNGDGERIKSDDVLVAEFKRRVRRCQIRAHRAKWRKTTFDGKTTEESGRVHSDNAARTGPLPAAQQSNGDVVSTCDDAQTPQCGSSFSRDAKGGTTSGHKHTTNSYRSA